MRGRKGRARGGLRRSAGAPLCLRLLGRCPSPALALVPLVTCSQHLARAGRHGQDCRQAWEGWVCLHRPHGGSAALGTGRAALEQMLPAMPKSAVIRRGHGQDSAARLRDGGGLHAGLVRHASVQATGPPPPQVPPAPAAAPARPCCPSTLGRCPAASPNRAAALLCCRRSAPELLWGAKCTEKADIYRQGLGAWPALRPGLRLCRQRLLAKGGSRGPTPVTARSRPSSPPLAHPHSAALALCCGAGGPGSGGGGGASSGFCSLAHVLHPFLSLLAPPHPPREIASGEAPERGRLRDLRCAAATGLTLNPGPSAPAAARPARGPAS